MDGEEFGRTVATRGGSIIIGVDEAEMQNGNLDKQNIVENIETEPQSTDKDLVGGSVNENTTKEEGNGFIDDDVPTCGWGSWRPKWAQVLNSPKGFCLFLCLFAMAQGMTVNGLIYVDTTTLEKRFELPSVRSGSISSCYDFSVTLVVIFVTYFGEKQHKPKLLGIGAIIFGFGCYTFSLPHFTTDYYHNKGGESGVSIDNVSTCDANRSIPSCIDEDSGKRTSLSSYYWVFVFAQLLHGIGASPLYTLGVTYLDDNVTSKLVAMYIGIFNAISILGPALGYVLGGLYLTIYTDVRVDPADHGISRESPIWVGAWWIGFLVSGSCCLLVSIPLLGYPRALPGAKLIAKERALNQNKDDDDDMLTRASYGGASIKNFPAAVWNLVKNIPYMMLNLSTCSEWFILAAMAVFGPKYMESQFNISPSLAAGICGAVVIPAGVGGTLLGGWVVKRFKLSVRGMLQFVLATLSVSTLLLACFFIYCDNVKFAGVTTQYIDKSLAYPKDMPSNITASCNVDCRCSQAYDPVCGVDEVMYYTGCHAGCTFSNENKEGILEYFDCACMNVTVEANEPMGSAVRCSIDCPLIPLFLTLLFFQMITTFMAIVPGTTAVLRIVDHEQRAFGLGIQSLMYRLLGTVPGPIIFGAIIDGQCLLWEKECNGSNGTCWLYDNESFSQYTLLMAGILKIVSLVTVAGSIVTLGSRGTESNNKPSTQNGAIVNTKDTVSVVSYRHFDTLSSPDI
ncbi:solute carrier organic anion transporter family member 4A1-like isoform X2 [Anneissia japonica]|uniref:solute carrier organic anion transporter family member 4A1-like isoform X2 n=1 Tax=Anneissia japonica TaxID=1529436 RepID=UPI0014258306|nr:solute carrier organic anion transporter family member 4A1-like isoform X2 [Anneissia japonica]